MRRSLLTMLVISVAALIAAGFLDTNSYADDRLMPAAVLVAPKPDVDIISAPPPAVVVSDASHDGLPAARPATVLVAVGDIMLSRNVGDEMKKHDNAYPFAGVGNLLRSGNVVFGNLETSIIPGRPIKTGEMVFRADPGSEVALKDAGFTVLSLANNHVPNFGPAAVSETIKRLADVGLVEVGAGDDDAQARRPAFVSRGGVIFAFLAYNDTDVVPASYGAAPGRAGTNLMDAIKMAADVAGAKKLADVVIVSMHAGSEYADWPNSRQVNFAKSAIDAGADLVIGHHPHVVQPVELYKGKYIFYSLGNFIFDQMWSEPTRRGLALKIGFNRGGITKLAVVPLYMKDFAQPRVAPEAEADKIFASLVMPVEKTPAGEYILKP